jgi:hypothetical protein
MAPLDVSVTIDSTTWAAVALLLTVLGAGLTWVAWRRRGPAAGIRGLAWTLLPVAAWLTGTLKLAAEVAGDVATWATRLVFSPVVWAGIVLAGVSVVLFALSGALRSRGIGVRGRAADKATRKARRVEAGNGAAGAVAPAAGAPAPRSKGRHPSDLDDMDDIEAILKKHGI